jgi:hypothetical protein
MGFSGRNASIPRIGTEAALATSTMRLPVGVGGGISRINSANAAGFVPDGSAETGILGSLGIDYWLGPIAMGRLVAWIRDLGSAS